MENLVLIGASTTAKTIFKFVNDHKLFNIAGFAVDPEYRYTDSYCDHPVFDLTHLDKIIDKKSDMIFISMQWNRLNKDRRDLYLRLKSAGYSFANIISPTAIIHGKIRGDNCWIADNVIIEANAEIGENTFVQSKVCIGPNTIIGPHCFIGIGSVLAGAVEIGEQSFVGINATIFDHVKIGKKSIIGACTKVKRSHPDFSIVKTVSDPDVVIQSFEDEIENKLLASLNIR
jgi:sugar O-acyltransferase (sialic acid O-acetyltransferase NeuD family)